MCLMTGASTARLPQAPAVAPAPTRASVTAAAANPISLVEESADIIAKRQGTFGNITTTPLGDATFGGMSFARFGAKKAA